jgi:hypothetical protein
MNDDRFNYDGLSYSDLFVVFVAGKSELPVRTSLAVQVLAVTNAMPYERNNDDHTHILKKNTWLFICMASRGDRTKSKASTRPLQATWNSHKIEIRAFIEKVNSSRPVSFPDPLPFKFM